MITRQERQIAFFEEIKRKLDPRHSLVDEVAILLDLSLDSVYRRIRAEKALSMEELFLLSKQFGVSVDRIFDLDNHTSLFTNWMIDNEDFTLESWLSTMADQLSIIKASKNKEIIYAAKDPAIFHMWNFPDIVAFKVFFWKKSVLMHEDYRQKKFSFDEPMEEVQKIGNRIFDAATKIPITEIWNESTFTTLLKQLEYYWIAGLFNNKAEVNRICIQFQEWILHMQEQAEKGFLFQYKMEKPVSQSSYTLYENELLLNDNTIVISTDHRKTAFLTYNVLNVLSTSEPGFTNRLSEHLHGVISNANQLSSIGAKARGRYFQKLLDQIQKFSKRFKD